MVVFKIFHLEKGLKCTSDMKSSGLEMANSNDRSNYVPGFGPSVPRLIIYVHSKLKK